MARLKKFYKRKSFWIAVIAAALIAAGVATYFFTKQAGVSIGPTTSNNQKGQGRIEIYTSPKGATITLDGTQRREKSPAKFSTSLGKHTVVLKLSGYDTATIPIQVAANNPAVIQQTFTKQGKITVSQKPADFKTYTNEQYRYRIRYPDAWSVSADTSGLVNFNNQSAAQAPKDKGEEQTSLTILTQPNPANLSPADWYKARPEYSQEDQSQIKTTELTIGGRPAFQYQTPYGLVPYLNTIVTGNGQAFILQQIQNSPERDTYDEVIKTFTLY